MISKLDKNTDRLARHARVRKKIGGTAERPRFDVYRSNMHIYVQVIDDVAGKTLAAASTVEKEIGKMVEGKSKTEAAKIVGAEAAKRAIAAGITEVVFDRGGYIYTGCGRRKRSRPEILGRLLWQKETKSSIKTEARSARTIPRTDSLPLTA